MLTWNVIETPQELHGLLRTLGEEYPLQAVEHSGNLHFRKVEDVSVLRVEKREDGFLISYGSCSSAGRGIAHALAGEEAAETLYFRTFGILFDCTRGNIITVEHFKFWLRRLSLLGYNLAMIYVKDAYQLPGEPYFGYMRGAYSLEEMQEVDDYARKLHIEMVASIQALGHLEPIMRWPAYNDIRDTSSAMMVDEPKSYELLEKILEFWSRAFSSRRIHLGMDETHDLGRGRFMDKNGYESPFDIYNRHLQRVCEICAKHHFEPIIWADMYFRYANANQDYYDQTAEVPEAVKRMIPRQVQLSYWDYYHRDASVYENMLRKTSALNGSAPFMASGVWTWPLFWTDYEQTRATVAPCMDACRKTDAREIVFALWGDDGGFCDFDSAFAGLAWTADYAIHQKADADRIAVLYQAVCRTDYRRQLIAGNLCYTFQDEVCTGGRKKIQPASIMWDDPVMGIAWHELRAYDPELPDRLIRNYEQIMEKLEPWRQDRNAGYLDYAWNTARVLRLKLLLRQKLEKDYGAGNMAGLREIREEMIPAVIEALQQFLAAYRTQWQRSFKHFGLELVQIRIGGQMERYRELARILDELTAGSIAAIPELEERIPVRGDIPYIYQRCATGCFFV